MKHRVLPPATPRSLLKRRRYCALSTVTPSITFGQPPFQSGGRSRATFSGRLVRRSQSRFGVRRIRSHSRGRTPAGQRLSKTSAIEAQKTFRRTPSRTAARCHLSGGGVRVAPNAFDPTLNRRNVGRARLRYRRAVRTEEAVASGPGLEHRGRDADWAVMLTPAWLALRVRYTQVSRPSNGCSATRA